MHLHPRVHMDHLKCVLEVVSFDYECYESAAQIKKQSRRFYSVYLWCHLCFHTYLWWRTWGVKGSTICAVLQVWLDKQEPTTCLWSDIVISSCLEETSKSSARTFNLLEISKAQLSPAFQKVLPSHRPCLSSFVPLPSLLISPSLPFPSNIYSWW